MTHFGSWWIQIVQQRCFCKTLAADKDAASSTEMEMRWHKHWSVSWWFLESICLLSACAFSLPFHCPRAQHVTCKYLPTNKWQMTIKWKRKIISLSCQTCHCVYFAVWRETLVTTKFARKAFNSNKKYFPVVHLFALHRLVKNWTKIYSRVEGQHF